MKVNGLSCIKLRTMGINVKVLGAVERQPVRWENCAKHVLCVCVAVI